MDVKTIEYLIEINKLYTRLREDVAEACLNNKNYLDLRYDLSKILENDNVYLEIANKELMKEEDNTD